MDRKFKEIHFYSDVMNQLHINRDKNILLKNASKGDKAAFVQLVVHYMPRIISKITNDGYKEFLHPDLLDSVINQTAVKLIEEEAAYVRESGKLKKNWQNTLLIDINYAIEDILGHTNYKGSKENYNTPERVNFLNKINRLLKETEQEIINRAIVCLETAEKKLRNEDSFTTHYFVEAQVNYFLKKSDHASHGYWDSFEYEGTIVKKYYGSLLSENDWHNPLEIWPELDEPYCYLMQDLLNHSKLYEKVFELNLIEVSIFYKDHKSIMIKKDGNSMHLKFDNQ